jgi:hypothetical protein
VTEKQIEGLGWTKLREVARGITKGNKVAMLKAAKTKTRDALKEYMDDVVVAAKTGKASPSADATPRMKFAGFQLFQDQGAALETIIENAKKAFEVDNMGEALMHAMSEWAQDREADIPADIALDAYNARYGTEFELDDGQEAAPEPVKAKRKARTAKAA